MTTMTAFDQSGDWEDRIFHEQTELENRESYSHNRDISVSTALEDPPYIPYVTPGDAEWEPIEVIDENPSWGSYFSGGGHPDTLVDDPYEEAPFLKKERIVPGSKIAHMSPRRSGWRFMG